MAHRSSHILRRVGTDPTVRLLCSCLFSGGSWSKLNPYPSPRRWKWGAHLGDHSAPHPFFENLSQTHAEFPNPEVPEV